MRKGMLFGVGAMTLALMAGCGGSGGDSSVGKVTRVLAGYVYVTKNDGGAYTGSTAFILPHNNLKVIDPTPANPESGDEVPIEKPTTGTIRLSIDGSITRAVTTEDFDLSESNEILCTVKGDANAAVTVSVVGGDPIMNGTVTKTLSVPTVTIGTSALNNTVLGVQSPSTPTYTPGAADTLRFRLRTTKGVGGTATNGAWLSPDEMMTSNGTGLGTGFVAGQVYDCAAVAFDKNGIVLTGATITLTSSDAPRVAVAGTQLTATSGGGLASGDVQITGTVTGATLVSGTFHGTYNAGGAASVTVTPAGPTALLWNTAGAAATTTLTATVKNEIGIGVGGATVGWTTNKSATVGGNDWDTGAFDSLTNIYSAQSQTTANDGTTTVTVTAPTSTATSNPAASTPAKGSATMTATVGSTTGTALINITRPLGSITIVGPTRLDVNMTSSSNPLSSLNYRVTGSADVDGDTVTNPTVTWNRTNTAGAGNVGNVGDTSAQSTSVATIDGATGVVTTGGIAGQVVVNCTDGTITSNSITTEIYGNPTKVVFNPDTVASVIGGAAGEYAGAANATQAFTFTLIDAYGHTVPFGEISTLTTTSSISSIAAGSITAGGSGVHGFTLTFGSSDGTFTIGTGGFTWTGSVSGTAVPLGGITRTAGANGS